MKISRSDILFGIPFFLGLILQIYAIEIFRLTFIRQEIVAGFYLLSGLAGYFILRNRIRGIVKNKILDIIIALAYSIVSVGGTLTYTLLASNYYFASGSVKKELYNITDTGSLGADRLYGCAEPYAEIERNGRPKEIVFDCDDDPNLFARVELTVSHGALGVYVIKRKKLAP